MSSIILSTARIADELARSERTIQRWIASGTLAARHIEGSLYEVDTLDLDAKRPRTPQERRIEMEQILASLQGLEHRLDALSGILEGLEHRVHFLESQSQRVHPVQSRSPEREMPVPALPVDIPSGSIRSHEFAARHGVNGHTFRDQIRKGVRGERVEVIMRPIPNRPGEHEYWLSPEQQRDCIVFWLQHGTIESE